LFPGTNLSALRTAHLTRMEREYARWYDRGGDWGVSAISSGSMSAGMWLVANGWDGDRCLAEEVSGWGPEHYRLYLSECDDCARATELEAGWRVLVAEMAKVEPMRLAA